MGKTTIEWTNETWNPIRGCAIVSKGCTNCYAMRQAHRSNRPGGAYEGLTKLSRGGPVWTGEARAVRELFEKPLSWKTPRRVFVNSMSDIFHDDVSWEVLDVLFAVMALADKHQFQILTKRPKRMLDYFTRPMASASLSVEGRVGRRAVEIARRRGENVAATNWDMWWEWPPRNVWLGVSVEDQRTAAERIPLLLRTPAAVRWISAEPLLEQLDFYGLIVGEPRLHWVVAGGESGPGARPMHPDWPRTLRDQCAQFSIPFFFKQWGSFLPGECNPGDPQLRWQDGRSEWYGDHADIKYQNHCISGANGRWVFAWPTPKAKAGRQLDGRTHDEYPA